MGNLDAKFLAELTIENIRKQFDDLINKKTDAYNNCVSIARGCDGIDHTVFEKCLEEYAKNICERGATGKYLFNPFREVETPKPPFGKSELEQAKKVGKVRTLSISTVQDTIFQNLIANAISDCAETKFAEKIDLQSYGYRKGKSSKMAVSRIKRFIDEGYLYVLDGDIEKFFDKIDHKLLAEKLRLFFGEDNHLILSYIRRFMHVGRIPVGEWDRYKFEMMTTAERIASSAKRLEGIPQGGVLSGLLANIFLFDFDRYVVETLMPRFGFKYFRYADDFVMLFKSSDMITEVYALINSYLLDQKLTLHPIGRKTKILDLGEHSRDTLDFLGFEISPKFLRVKEDNLKKFRNRIKAELRKIDSKQMTESYFEEAIVRINSKITGLEDLIEQHDGLCPECKKLIPKRSWIGYFSMATDVRMFKNIDTIIRTEIYADYCKRTGKHLPEKLFKCLIGKRLKSSTRMYYIYKKQIRKYGHMGYCKCERARDMETGQLVVRKEKTGSGSIAPAPAATS